MSKPSRAVIGAIVVALCATAALATGFAHRGAATAAPAANCQLGNKDGQIKHVIYLQFDNVHYRRDVTGVPSDLEQMPHLLNFLKSNGTLLTNDHTILISHTGGGIVSSLTGLYPDREGLTVSNSYDYFQTSGVDRNNNSLVGVPKNTTAFKYWTDTVDGPNETMPNMVGDGGQTAPAPWLTYTHAGCNVGGVSAANIELENANTSPSGDITRVFGNPSPEFSETQSDPHKAQTDFVGIAVHCAKGSTLCSTNTAKPDDATTVPGSNDGYLGLFGAKYVNPQIGGSGAGNGCIQAEGGGDITDPAGNCGFPGFDGALAKNTLGEVEAMQEHGVQVTYAYLSDVHDFHVPDPVGDTFRSSARGPGEIDYQNQLKDYDKAFETFFSSLAAHGIDKSNTLFVVTVDEGDHFTGGTGTPDPSNPGAFVYSHTNCTDLSACPSNQMGEVNINLPAFLPAGEPTYDIHFDDAPTFYVKGQPERTNPAVRKLEQDLGALTLPDPYATGGSARAVFQLADPVEEQTLHMIDNDPLRTPTFTMFGNDDFFFTLSKNCGSFDACAAPGFAWNHGDSQEVIGNTWAGYVGPGVASDGVVSNVWTDHTDLRPTINALLGVQDSYLDDGRVVTQILDNKVLPKGLHDQNAQKVGDIDKQLNAPFGQFAMDTLNASTAALESNDPLKYDSIESAIANLTVKRNALAGEIRQALNDAAAGSDGFDGREANSLVSQAQGLLDEAHALAVENPAP